MAFQKYPLLIEPILGFFIVQAKLTFLMVPKQILSAGRVSDSFGGLRCDTELGKSIWVGRAGTGETKRVSEIKGACGDGSEKYGWGSLLSPPSSDPCTFSLACGMGVPFSPHIPPSPPQTSFSFSVLLTSFILDLSQEAVLSHTNVHSMCWKCSVTRALTRSGLCPLCGCEAALGY